MLTRRSFTPAAVATAIGSALSSVLPFPAIAGDEPRGAFPVTKTDEEWKRTLTPEQYYVLRQHGTERAFTSPLDKTYAAGEYRCAGCGSLLFVSDTKFDSRTGWPSFWKPVENAVGTKTDRSFFMVRTEVHCATCGGHLGHVFPDGPPPTGQRYCMNGVAMTFVPKPEPTATGGKTGEKS
jgi:peptide-methionine (R)-S-oxide reductase